MGPTTKAERGTPFVPGFASGRELLEYMAHKSTGPVLERPQSTGMLEVNSPASPMSQTVNRMISAGSMRDAMARKVVTSDAASVVSMLPSNRGNNGVGPSMSPGRNLVRRNIHSSNSTPPSPSSLSRTISGGEDLAFRTHGLQDLIDGSRPASAVGGGSTSLPVGGAPSRILSGGSSTRISSGQGHMNIDEQQPQPTADMIDPLSSTTPSVSSSMPPQRSARVRLMPADAVSRPQVTEVERSKKRPEQTPQAPVAQNVQKSTFLATRSGDGQKEVEQDPVYDAVLKFCANRPPTRFPLVKLSRGVYLYGNKKLVIAIINDKLMVRIGGGFVNLESYLLDMERTLPSTAAAPRYSAKGA